MKFESALAATGSEEEVTFFARVSVILKRVAPGAFAFVVPVEGSRRVESLSLVVIASVVVNPIRYVGVLLYFSRTNVCARQRTKKPLTKNTPRLILTTDAPPIWPVAAAVPSVADPSS